MSKSSRVSGFHKMTLQERIKIVADFAELNDEEIALLGKSSVLGMDTAERLIENVIGTFELPLGVVPNMRVNDRDVLIPITVEESSVVAAMANAGKMALSGGGFYASTSGPIMIGQIQTVNLSDPFAARIKILEHKEEIISLANQQDPILVKLGGGCEDVEVRVLDSEVGPMVVTHIIVDTRDAMGANAVNTMAEFLAPYIEKWTGGRVFLRILSNLADRRLARARCLVKKDAIPPGPDVVDGIVTAWAFGDADPYRAATHNKGIMNGVSALVIATGNDFRAVEAGAHAFAARTGRYRTLTRWEKNAEGDLVGSIELPLALGLIGGATSVHPLAKVVIKILGVKTASELAEIGAAAGLCQNMAALRVLAAEGVQRGHMSLHAKNIAMMAGASGDEIDKVAERLKAEGKVRVDRAAEILNEIRET
ncbi:MAG TPA: hydroxymethylglutaryl-CoA reductase, degradative [Desulfobacteraceae bacterium]|nr:hydroxymethylglutaryl-CoA reductase, degradative [Desulfobacteraceae bacterium]